MSGRRARRVMVRISPFHHYQEKHGFPSPSMGKKQPFAGASSAHSLWRTPTTVDVAAVPAVDNAPQGSSPSLAGIFGHERRLRRPRPSPPEPPTTAGLRSSGNVRAGEVGSHPWGGTPTQSPHRPLGSEGCDVYGSQGSFLPSDDPQLVDSVNALTENCLHARNGMEAELRASMMSIEVCGLFSEC
jgi:hypothetical protein